MMQDIVVAVLVLWALWRLFLRGRLGRAPQAGTKTAGGCASGCGSCATGCGPRLVLPRLRHEMPGPPRPDTQV